MRVVHAEDGLLTRCSECERSSKYVIELAGQSASEHGPAHYCIECAVKIGQLAAQFLLSEKLKKG